MNTFLDFLTTSSADPEKYSATLVGILTSYAGALVSVLNIFNLGVTYAMVIKDISIIGVVIGLFLSMFGLGRKIYFLIKNPTTPVPPTETVVQ